MNERFYTLPPEKQQAIINAGYRVFSQNSYKNSPMSEIAEARNQQISAVPLFPQRRGCILFRGTNAPVILNF